MPVIPDQAAFQNSLASLAVVTYQPGETVIADGSKTGRLLILKKGTVTIEKEGTEIAKVAEPGAVFGATETGWGTGIGVSGETGGMAD